MIILAVWDSVNNLISLNFDLVMCKRDITIKLQRFLWGLNQLNYMKHLAQGWHLASVNISLNFYYSSIIIIIQSLSHVSPKAERISSPSILVYNHKAFLNASNDREITTLYIVFITVPGKFPPAGSRSVSWTRSLFPTPQSIPLAIPKDKVIWDRTVLSDYLQQAA